jgi:formylglycine-generating enzyme required for sulfatase activity
LHRQRIGRTFALATKPVTVGQFLRFRKDHDYRKAMAPTEDCPVNRTDWYMAAAYCNWLSDQEGIPKEQWCYETNRQGEVTELKEQYLSLIGYRLPTEAEWEYACRAGAMTSRYYGETEDLLGRYAWWVGSSKGQSRPVGSLKPNDFGLFDMHGQVWVWCQERFKVYAENAGTRVVDDTEDSLIINDREARLLRGGSYLNRPGGVRSAHRNWNVPAYRPTDVGFRPARTFH